MMSDSNPHSIETLLRHRGARLLRRSAPKISESWHATARYLAENYVVFDRLRLHFIHGPERSCRDMGRDERAMLDTLEKRGFIHRKNGVWRFAGSVESRFLLGGWLEWMTREALLRAGADEALCCQQLKWRVDGYHGRNEIDAIGRRNQRMVFASCKAAKSVLGAKSGQRSQLMSYLHETDNLYDHFGRKGDQVVLVVTTDLIEEANDNRARYPALFGKARALDVHLVTLEDLKWNRFVGRLRAVLNRMERD